MEGSRYGTSSANEPSMTVGLLPRSQLPVSITKFLRHHQPADAAVQDADAEAPELGVQDVGAVAR